MDPVYLGEKLPLWMGRWARQVVGAATMFNLDPLLIFAIMERESGGGKYLTPKEAHGVGDGGNGLGLMQIDRRYHKTFAVATGPSGHLLWQEPWANISYGCALIRLNLEVFVGSELCSIACYNASPTRARVEISKLRQGHTDDELRKALDGITTGGDYVTDVLRRREVFRKLLGGTKNA